MNEDEEDFLTRMSVKLLSAGSDFSIGAVSLRDLSRSRTGSTPSFLLETVVISSDRCC